MIALDARWSRLALLLLLAGCRCGGDERVVADTSPPRAAPTAPSPSAANPSIPRDDHGLPAEQGAVVLARIDGRAITVLDYLDDYERARGADRLRFAMPAGRGSLLERRLREELLADEARRRDHGEDPRVLAAREETARRVLIEELRREHPPTTPTEPELLALYTEEPERWHRPARVRTEFVRGTREEATAVLERAKGHRDPIRAMREWALESSSPTVASGQLGPFAHPSSAWREATPIPRAVAEAAHATPAGSLHPEVIEADGSFWVLHPVVREPETRIAFEDARDELALLFAERAFERLLTNALPEARVTIDEAALGAVRRP